MDKSTRLTLIEVMAQLSEIFPEMRFGQLVCNLASLVDTSPEAVWTVRDDSLLVEARAFLDRQVDRLDINVPTTLSRAVTAGPSLDGPRLTAAEDGRRAILTTLLNFDSSEPIGKLVANLFALGKAPTSATDWSATIWETEDDEFREVLTRSLDRASSPLLDWSYRFSAHENPANLSSIHHS